MPLPSRKDLTRLATAAAPYAVVLVVGLLLIAAGIKLARNYVSLRSLSGQVSTYKMENEALRGSLTRARTVSDSTADLLALAQARADSASQPLRGEGAFGNRVIIRRVIEHDTLVRIDTLTPELPPADTGALTEEQAARALPIIRDRLDKLIVSSQVNQIAWDAERSSAKLVEMNQTAQIASLEKALAHERNPWVRAGRAVKWVGVGIVTGGGAVLLLL